MFAGNGRLLARTMRDVTVVAAEDLATERVSSYDVFPSLAAPVYNKSAKTQFVCIASGKGGTGKTVVTTNLAVTLSQLGLKVLLLDADMGLANAHLLLGVTPLLDISSVLKGNRRISEVVLECKENLSLVSGGSGFSELAELDTREMLRLAHELETCEDDFDIVLVDLSAGIHPQVMRFLGAAHDVILVTTPDVTALLDAYATIKSMANIDEHVSTKIIINRAKDRKEAILAFKKIQLVTEKHLPLVTVNFFGWLPQNFYIQDSVSQRQPVVELYPKSFVSEELRTIAKRIKSGYSHWSQKNTSEETSKEAVATFSARLKQSIFE